MNFLVWRRGLRGPYASLDDLDPRQSSDWKVNQQTTIVVIALPAEHRALSLDAAIVAYPCPQEASAP